MKVLHLVPLALILGACTSANVPIAPYRIDVRQGNALEQEAVDKLKPGLSRSQVRYLLGTPLLVDPFHGNRWDYVYNYRKAGKLVESRRLALFFDGDVLARMESEGIEPKGEAPVAQPPEKPVEPAKGAAAESARPAQAAPAQAGASESKPEESSVVAPLRADEGQPGQSPRTGAAAGESEPEPVTLQRDTNVETVKQPE